MPRPYVVLSAAVSVDGYLDDASQRRLILSSEADLDRVDELRAASDAILVGAGTIRADDPVLLIRSAARRAARQARGLPEHPAKVTLTRSGRLSPRARFFTAGETARLVYAAAAAAGGLAARLGGAAEITEIPDAGDSLEWVLEDLARRGISRLLAEGGASVLGQFLRGGLADELQLVVAPFFVGDPAAPRFPGAGPFRHGRDGPMRLAEARRIGGHVLLRYRLTG
jgi:5-amino-6-(5-phosphoribosylamino)uracil reductase